MIALTPVLPANIDPKEDARLREVAEAFSARDARFEADRQQYDEQFPGELPVEGVLTLHVDDFSIISNVQELKAIDGYPSRAFVRVRDGDLVAATFAPIPGYEQYLAEQLGLGRSTYVRADPALGALTYAGFEGLLSDDRAQGEIEQRIREDGRAFWIHPYMGLEAAWRFGQRMAERSGRPTRLIGPLPTITERANNKLWFTEVAGAVLGHECTLESHVAESVDAAAELLLRLATTAPGATGTANAAGNEPRVALKLSDSASGQGTEIFGAAEVRDRSPESLRRLLGDWLSAHDWGPGAPPLSVERWEADILGSPSIQLWIPPGADFIDASTGEGEPPPTPLLEGVFDQLFYPGDETVFLGSVPSRLPAQLRDRIGEAGVWIGRVFQYLGYVGRCSFDTILIGDSLDDATIVFTECNGRWGGTSTPMSLMNRLFGDYREKSYFCQNFSADGLKGVPFDELARGLDDVLFDVTSDEGWAIVFNVGCLDTAGKLDLITLGATFEEAEGRQEEFQRIVEARF